MPEPELVQRINQFIDELDFVTARKLIEENIEYLDRSKHLLNSNARELFNFIHDQFNAGYQPMTRKEMAIVHAINMYASKFDIRGIRLLVKDYASLFMRRDIEDYLHNDAITILESIGVIK